MIDPSGLPADLTVAAVCDALDGLGRRSQAMHHRLRPLDPARARFAGRAIHSACPASRAGRGDASGRRQRTLVSTSADPTIVAISPQEKAPIIA